MANGTVDQAKTGTDGPFANIFNGIGIADAFNVRIGTEFQIDFITILNGALCQILTDEFGQITADFTASGELAVRKSTGARKAGCDVAVRFAVHANLGFALGTVTFFNSGSFFNHHDSFADVLPNQFQRRKNTRRTGADN